MIEPGYMPRDPRMLVVVGGVLIATLLAGLAIGRMAPGRNARTLAWLVTITATAGVERLCHAEPAGVRMLAIIAALLYGMKAVVTVEARAGGMPVMRPWRWLGFASLWPGMRPAPFGRTSRQDGGWALIGHGCVLGLTGLALALLARFVWHGGRPALADGVACVLATVLLLPGLSLMLHFGIFNVLAGSWRLAGVDARPLFRAPLAARSLENFWSRRWNLAFSEMTTLGVYRPLSGPLGRPSATVCAFIASGILHELAISVPVLAGVGLPMSYFLLHGMLVLFERGLEKSGRSVSSWSMWSRVWVIGWLALPLPILFHPPFLRGVIWPLIDLQ